MVSGEKPDPEALKARFSMCKDNFAATENHGKLFDQNHGKVRNTAGRHAPRAPVNNSAPLGGVGDGVGGDPTLPISPPPPHPLNGLAQFSSGPSANEQIFSGAFGSK